MMSRERIVSGVDAAPRGGISLWAGPLEMLFETDTAFLRDIRIGGVEVIRGVYAAVRDRNWGTIAPELSNLVTQLNGSSFQVRFDARCREREIDFAWRGEIIGREDGTVICRLDGEALSTFMKNRIGFCILHPLRGFVGKGCKLEYSDGRVVEAVFPEFVASEQPVSKFNNLRAISHEFEPGHWIEVRMEGDVFETEDQRNWIDASYKTYCTPLGLPRPLQIEAGTRVRQTVTVRFASSKPPASVVTRESAAGDPVTIEEGGGTVALPEIGLCVSSNKSPGNIPNRSVFDRLELSHLRHDLQLGAPDWSYDLLRASTEACELGLPLELAIHLPADGAECLDPLAKQLARQTVKPYGPGLKRVMVFRDGQKSTNCEDLTAARWALGNLGVPIGVGTDADFYQLNQFRPPHREADFVCWSMNPQVHVFDTRSILQTPEAIPAQVKSALHHFGGKPLVVSPVTLKPRFNPVATGPESGVREGGLPSQVDPRQMSLAMGCWVIAVMKQLAEAGVASATFFETTGWLGLMETRFGSPISREFPSFPGMVFPVYYAFAALKGSSAMIPTNTSAPDRIAAMTLTGVGGSKRLVLANMSCEEVKVCLPPGFRSLRILDEDNAELAMRDPATFLSKVCEISSRSEIVLKRHALAMVD